MKYVIVSQDLHDDSLKTYTVEADTKTAAWEEHHEFEGETLVLTMEEARELVGELALYVRTVRRRVRR